MTDEETEGPPAKAAGGVWGWLQKYGRWLLLVVGFAFMAYLIRDSDPERVAQVLAGAGMWLPLVALGEIGFVGMDVVSLRLMFGEHGPRVPGSAWLRSAMMAYGIMVLLPAGRAGGEVARAAVLAPHVGAARAAAGATLLQGVTMWGNTLVSIPCVIAVALVVGGTGWLTLLTGVNGLITAIIGTVVLLGARRAEIGGWLGNRIGALAAHGARFDESLKEMPAVPVVPILAAFAGRLSQTLQYGVILVAVGGAFTLSGTFVAQAIHLVGAGLGDLIPNAAGITEGAFLLFADDLGIPAAAALSIALVHRLTQYALAGLSLVVTAVWRGPEQTDGAAAPSGEPADVL